MKLIETASSKPLRYPPADVSASANGSEQRYLAAKYFRFHVE